MEHDEPIRPEVLNRPPARRDGSSAHAAPLPAAQRLRRRSLDLRAAALDAGRAAGRPEYAAVRRRRPAGALTRAAAVLRQVSPLDLPAGDALAFWVNCYNALVVQGAVALGLRRRVDELPGGLDGFFRRAAYDIGGLVYSLDDIEHGVLRANRGHRRVPGPHFAPDDPRLAHVLPRVDPRIHFVLHCGAVTCPAVGVLDARDAETQLDAATHAHLHGPDGAAYDARDNALTLPAFMRWNTADFGGEAGCVAFVARHVPELGLDGRSVELRFRDYDWRLG